METSDQRYLSLRRRIMEGRFKRMNDMQKAAVFHTEGPLLILAGAGSGKTTVIVNRIANLLLFGNAYESDYVPPYLDGEGLAFLERAAAGGEADEQRLRQLLSVNAPRPWQILAITFTNKAAAELRDRLAAMLGAEEASDIMAATFHSVCVRILRSEVDSTPYKRGFAIYDSDDQQRVMKEALKHFNLDDKTFQPRSMLAAIGESKDLLETPAMMLERAKGNYKLEVVAKLYEFYQNRLLSSNAMDFDDIISQTVRLFDGHPEVLHKYQKRYQYVMVDEYQDTNRSQFKLVSQFAGGCHNLCVVGDDDQSIYRFRGATIENILSFERRFEGAKVIRLEENYRSTQNILDAANDVIRHNTARKGKTLWTGNGEGEKVTLYSAFDERDEANFIAETIAAYAAGGKPYRDNAVLYRINAQSNAIENAFVMVGIPYRVIGGTRFYDRKEIRDMIAYLSVINNQSDTLRLLRIVNEPKRGIGDATLSNAQQIADVLGSSLFSVLASADEYAPLQKKAKALLEFSNMIARLVEDAETLTLDALLEEILEDTGYREALMADPASGPTRLENIEELKSSMKQYEAETEEPSLSGFLEEVALFTDLDRYDQNADTVTLMTLHSAKGLEFERVFIPGVEEGLFPSSRSMNDPEQLEEERRLCYVGVTRAKKKLFLIAASRRMLFGQTMFCRDSRFLSEIGAGLLEGVGRKKTLATAASKVAGTHQSRPAEPRQSLGVGASPKKGAGFVPSPGERVHHRVFGDGTVRSVAPMGGDHMIEIAFDSVGVKKIMATYAKLTRSESSQIPRTVTKRSLPHTMY